MIALIQVAYNMNEKDQTWNENTCDKAQSIDPKLTTIISEMFGATNIQSNQVCILQNYQS